MTLTIDLTPLEEATLNAAARQEGLDPPALIKRFVAGLTPTTDQRLTEEKRLVEEYHALLACEDSGTLSEDQALRLRQVEAELDALEDQDPIEQAADRRLQETSDKLDEILVLLQRLPRKPEPQ